LLGGLLAALQQANSFELEFLAKRLTFPVRIDLAEIENTKRGGLILDCSSLCKRKKSSLPRTA